jgi:hypothetical protein
VENSKVYEDKRSGIVSDPNREDDPEYIVRLADHARGIVCRWFSSHRQIAAAARNHTP